MARILQCTEAQYRADPCSTPSLSQSIAKTLLERSPLHAYLQHPRFGNERKESSKAQDEGQLIHTLLLKAGVNVAIINNDSFRTKAAQEQRDGAIAQGCLPVLAHKYEAALIGVERIRANLKQFGIELDGASEVALEWEEPAEHGHALCRAKLDHFYQDKRLIIDVKKTDSAHPAAIGRAVESYMYALQMAAYTRAATELCGDLVDFLFVFVECDPPYAVTPARLNGQFAEIGERQWRRAVDLWAKCLLYDEWPAYTQEAVVLQPREWYAAQEMALGEIG